MTWTASWRQTHSWTQQGSLTFMWVTQTKVLRQESAPWLIDPKLHQLLIDSGRRTSSWSGHTRTATCQDLRSYPIQFCRSPCRKARFRKWSRKWCLSQSALQRMSWQTSPRDYTTSIERKTSWGEVFRSSEKNKAGILKWNEKNHLSWQQRAWVWDSNWSRWATP